jgi:hypothetical protein
MTLSTSTITLAPGISRTYNLAPGEAVTVATEPNCYVTVTETPEVITTADQGGQTNVRESILQYKGEWTYGPYALGGTVVVAVSLAKSTSSVAVTLGSAAAAVVGAGGIRDDYQRAASSGYFCHLYAPNQTICDPYVLDLSGALNNATFGTGLSKAECWTTAGFASTAAVNTDEVLHMPAIGFDMSGGESMFFMWKGQITAPASALPFIGDSAGSSSQGIAPMRILTDGTCQAYVSGGSGLASFFAISGVVADGTTHAFGLVLDGVANRYQLYVDGVASGGYTSITNRDTVTTNQLMLGNTQSSIWGTSTSLTSKTQALVILHGRTGLGLPAGYDALMKQVMMNPGKLVTKAEW